MPNQSRLPSTAAANFNQALQIPKWKSRPLNESHNSDASERLIEWANSPRIVSVGPTPPLHYITRVGATEGKEGVATAKDS